MKKDKIFILIFSITVFISLIIPVLDKTLFVSPTGHWNTIDPLAAFLISVGVYYGWKLIRVIFLCLFVLLLIVEAILALSAGSAYSENFLLMLIIHAGLFVIFIRSIPLKNNFKHA